MSGLILILHVFGYKRDLRAGYKIAELQRLASFSPACGHAWAFHRVFLTGKNKSWVSPTISATYLKRQSSNTTAYKNKKERMHMEFPTSTDSEHSYKLTRPTPRHQQFLLAGLFLLAACHSELWNHLPKTTKPRRNKQQSSIATGEISLNLFNYQLLQSQHLQACRALRQGLCMSMLKKQWHCIDVFLVDTRWNGSAKHEVSAAAGRGKQDASSTANTDLHFCSSMAWDSAFIPLQLKWCQKWRTLEKIPVTES